MQGGTYAAQGSRLPSPKFMLLDNLDGSYNFICFSRNNLFVSCHVKGNFDSCGEISNHIYVMMKLICCFLCTISAWGAYLRLTIDILPLLCR